MKASISVLVLGVLATNLAHAGFGFGGASPSPGQTPFEQRLATQQRITALCLTRTVGAWATSSHQSVDAGVAAVERRLESCGYTLTAAGEGRKEGTNAEGDQVALGQVEGGIRLEFTLAEGMAGIIPRALANAFDAAPPDPALTRGIPGVYANPFCVAKPNADKVVLACGSRQQVFSAAIGYSTDAVSAMSPLAAIAGSTRSQCGAEGEPACGDDRAAYLGDDKLRYVGKSLGQDLEGTLPRAAYDYGTDADPVFEDAGYRKVVTHQGETIWVGDNISSTFRAMRIYQNQASGLRTTVIGHIYSDGVGNWVSEFSNLSGMPVVSPEAPNPAPGRCDIARVIPGKTGSEAEAATAKRLLFAMRHPGFAVRIRCAAEAPVPAPVAQEQAAPAKTRTVNNVQPAKAKQRAKTKVR